MKRPYKYLDLCATHSFSIQTLCIDSTTLFSISVIPSLLVKKIALIRFPFSLTNFGHLFFCLQEKNSTIVPAFGTSGFAVLLQNTNL